MKRDYFTTALLGVILATGLIFTGCASAPKVGEGETLITVKSKSSRILTVWIDDTEAHDASDPVYPSLLLRGRTKKLVVPNGEHHLYVKDGSFYSEAIVFNADSKKLHFSVIQNRREDRPSLSANADSQSNVIAKVDNPKGYGEVAGKWHAEVSDGKGKKMLFVVFRDDGTGVLAEYVSSNKSVRFPGGVNPPLYDNLAGSTAFTYTSGLEDGLTIAVEDETDKMNMSYRRPFARELLIDRWFGGEDTIEFEKDYRWHDPRDEVGSVLLGVENIDIPWPQKSTVTVGGKEITIDETYNTRLAAGETLPPSYVDTFIYDLRLNGAGNFTKESILAVFDEYLADHEALIGYRQWNHFNFIGYIIQIGALDQLVQDVIDYVARYGVRLPE
jgi:hypothetical protein